MLTKKTKYALRALVYLAENQANGPVLIAKLAADEKMPRKFLERILLELNNEGILQSKKGKGGGYFLHKRTNEIKVGDVVRLMDGPLAPVSCVSKTAYARCKDCGSESSCKIRGVMKEARDAIAEILDGTSLADMMNMTDESKNAWSYVI
ncbi:MAG TPA: Rrf2 family transcriptional regulator [Kiritimatiellia bacterium]|nr:Rrf2 family transcriptional regulator [Kiritimatiellia bacterium]